MPGRNYAILVHVLILPMRKQVSKIIQIYIHPSMKMHQVIPLSISRRTKNHIADLLHQFVDDSYQRCFLEQHIFYKPVRLW